MIAEYLNTVLEEGNDADVISAIGHIAKAIGMTKIAEETGMSRPSLYMHYRTEQNHSLILLRKC